MAENLVFVQNGQAFTTSKVIAQGVEIEHESIMRTLKQYQADFETFGIFRFEIGKLNGGRGRPETVALLNEQQATLLVTYCKNTEVVRKFKVALVKAFYEARQAQLTEMTGDTITNAQQVAIQQAVARRAKKTAAHYQTIYRSIKTRYQIPRYTELKQSQFEDCLRFIEVVDLRLPEAPKTATHPEIKKPQRYVVNADFLKYLQLFCYYQRYLFKKPLLQAMKVMKALDVPDACKIWEAVNDQNLAALELSLDELGFSVKDLDCYKHWSLTHVA